MENNIVVSGKRKTSVAKATIKSGKGIVTINKRPISLLPYLQQLEINEPLVIAKDVLGKLDFDIEVKVVGGGIASRIEAARLAIARAIVKFTNNEDLKGAYLIYDRNLLVADTRRKEAYKPGDSKARSMRQSSKR
ncbi:30S ribosomal protein S9 [Candidatus Pacearchaeota archaeon]|nr:30S ribosomal protein S9 [Candidatus Pacearchaeota archaeon]|tara:strand:- start:4328 stop:4732 length:405 start_codon:yes stop_codon:yes gene_type:complete